MKRLSFPASLSIALWLTGSIWLVAIVAHLFDAPVGIVTVTLLFGAITGLIEWLVSRSRR